jgi:hypothetical protein
MSSSRRAGADHPCRPKPEILRPRAGRHLLQPRLRPPAALIPAVEGLDHLIEESRRQEAEVVAIAVRTLAQVVTRPENSLPSSTTIQERSSSSPRCRLIGSGISMADAGSWGARCVIGSTVTTVALSVSRSMARTMTLGLSFVLLPFRPGARGQINRRKCEVAHTSSGNWQAN